MPRFRPRFTVRRLMILVATLVAGGIEGERRRARFRQESENYFLNVLEEVDERSLARRQALATYHRQMEAKYEWAMRYPWLPVMPDPPEPD